MLYFLVNCFGNDKLSYQYQPKGIGKFVSDKNLELSMSRRGNCHGNNDGVSLVEFEKQYYEKLSSL